jgi:hypothetical protein
MVPMKNNVLRFPHQRNCAPEVPRDDTVILLSLEGRRFAIRWIVTELATRPAEVISMQKQRRRKKRPRST